MINNDFDVTDYSAFLDAERDELLREAVEQERANHWVDQLVAEMALEFEVQVQLGMMSSTDVNLSDK